MKKIVFSFTVSLIILAGCKNEKKIIQAKKESDKIDTIIASPNNIISNFNYCDLIASKGFTSIKLDTYNIPNIDSLSFGFRFKNDTLKLSYQFSNTNKNKQDRNVIYKNKKIFFKRIIIKDSATLSFNGFMCDYRNANFYSNVKYILIKSRPENWSGSINQFRFYQLIDKDKKLCYEFFLNEKTKCK